MILLLEHSAEDCFCSLQAADSSIWFYDSKQIWILSFGIQTSSYGNNSRIMYVIMYMTDDSNMYTGSVCLIPLVIWSIFEVVWVGICDHLITCHKKGWEVEGRGRGKITTSNDHQHPNTNIFLRFCNVNYLVIGNGYDLKFTKTCTIQNNTYAKSILPFYVFYWDIRWTVQFWKVYLFLSMWEPVVLGLRDAQQIDAKKTVSFWAFG